MSHADCAFGIWTLDWVRGFLLCGEMLRRLPQGFQWQKKHCIVWWQVNGNEYFRVMPCEVSYHNQHKTTASNAFRSIKSNVYRDTLLKIWDENESSSLERQRFETNRKIITRRWRGTWRRPLFFPKNKGWSLAKINPEEDLFISSPNWGIERLLLYPICPVILLWLLGRW